MSSGQSDLFAQDNRERKKLSESQRSTIRSRLEATLVKLDSVRSRRKRGSIDALNGSLPGSLERPIS